MLVMLAFLTAVSAFGQKLNLTPEQKAQAKQIFSQARRDARPLRQEIKQNRQAIALAITSGKSEAEIRQLSAAQGNAMGQLIALRSQAHARFIAQLTPEQKAQADDAKGKIGRRLARRKLR
jgi:Spy/CpxP family protein refolding chaperone